MRHTRIYSLSAASAIAVAAATPAMAQNYYIGQMIEVGANFCPRGFAETSGQLLSIAQNAALFSLLGTTYGGNGVQTFGLPDLRGRMAIGLGQGPGLAPYVQGQIAGTESVTLTVANLPVHSHTGVFETSTAAANDPKSFRNAFAVTADNQYTTSTNLDVTMNSETITVQGAGDVTSTTAAIMSPFLVTRYCIATQGIFPSRN